MTAPSTFTGIAGIASYVAVVEIRFFAHNICLMIDSQHYEDSCDMSENGPTPCTVQDRGAILARRICAFLSCIKAATDDYGL